MTETLSLTLLSWMRFSACLACCWPSNGPLMKILDLGVFSLQGSSNTLLRDGLVFSLTALMFTNDSREKSEVNDAV